MGGADTLSNRVVESLSMQVIPFRGYVDYMIQYDMKNEISVD